MALAGYPALQYLQFGRVSEFEIRNLNFKRRTGYTKSLQYV